jgi:transcriptional regulator with XRE-family HTH domain
MSMSERLRTRREALRLSQQALSDQAGVSRVTIARIEMGTQTTITTDTAKALARALGVSVDFLIGTWEDETASTP